MRRGRPAMGEEFRRQILSILGHGEYPVTATTIKHQLEKARGRRCGWDTVRKYLDELVGDRLVIRQALPTRHGRKPLVVYAGRTAQVGSRRQCVAAFSKD